ncbi:MULTISPECIES: helix-turn-helix domain-containing protein [unclassified Streptomyces]|uniref:helix-turn-helix domain-containing protein n=1 Tax=unclassified Streptomyces TaxID=2593676 RepID=UPI0036EAD7FA
MHRDKTPDRVLARRRAIGAQLREARKEASLTQQELGDRINRDVKSISRWENGHRAPSLDDLIALSEGLEKPLAHLVR